MFDASNRQTCRVRMSTTSTPLHALTTLNDPTWVEAARVLAEHAIKFSPNDEDQIRFVFREVVGRKPNEKEILRLLKALEKQSSYYSTDPAASQQFLDTGSYIRDKSLDATAHAALTAVCLAVFNLDEALTRE